MSTTSRVGRATPGPSTGGISVRALAGALVFVGSYLLLDVVHGALATQARPMPNASDDEIHHYLIHDGVAVAANSAVLLVSACGLLGFMLAARRLLMVRAVYPVRWGSRSGLLAVVALAVSAMLSIVLAASASAMASGTAAWLHYVTFLAGGVTHVVCLGVFVALTARAFGARGVRVLSLVAAVPAVMSVISLLWFYGAVLILLGRLLCMLWIVVAAISLVRTQ